MENYNQYFEQGSLIFKYLNGALTDQEKQELNSWISESEHNQALFNSLTEEHELASLLREFPAADKDEAWERVALETGFSKFRDRKTLYRSLLKYGVAAMLLLVSGTVLLKVINKKPVGEVPVTAAVRKVDLLPGKNKAVLTLSDGSEIILDNVSKGKIAQQENMLITKTDDGQLVYTLSNSQKSQATNDGVGTFNHIRTPRGGQYKVILPDGSKVWLNAASSLKYSTEFSKSGRIVELTGEAYFEIAKLDYVKDGQNQRVPFRVFSAGQFVEVLGTRFNINSYADERSITTTLVEGSVRIIPGRGNGTKNQKKTTREVLLEPGEQARLTANGQYPVDIVKGVDMEEVIAWKNGQFQFKDADIRTIMRQISRWYDVEVEFEGKVSETRYRGKVPRDVPISQLFEILQTSGVNFKIEGRKIIVTT